MKKILYYITATIFSFNLCAQDTLITEKDTIITNTGKIEVDQVEVIKAFEAKLSDAKRIGFAPKVKAVVPVEKTYNYDITIVPVDIIYPDPMIRPLAMNSDAPKNVAHFFTRLGYGDLKSPYADASYQYVKGDEYDFIIDAHFYGADDSEEIENRKFYESALNIKGGYRIGENNKVSLALGGKYDIRNLYDTLKAATYPDFDIVKRKILNIGSELAFQNIETTSGGFDYIFNINGGFTNLGTKINASEVRFGTGLKVQKTFSEKFSILLDADASFYDIDESSSDTTLQQQFTIKPGIRFSIGSFTMKALADVFIDERGTNPFIEAEANLAILENSLQIYLGVDQKVQINSLANKLRSNPFVNRTALEHRNTIAKQYYAGVRGKMKDFLTFNFSAGYESIKDQRFDTDQYGILMRSIYDDMTNIFINANLEFKVNDHISVGGIVNQNFFDPETLGNVINMASYSYNAYSKITLLSEKLVIKADINLADKIYWEDFAFQEQYSGNKQLDLSIGVDYYFTKNIGLWIRGNNLLDREYLKYHYYPGFGRNLLGGITARF